eukprot:2680691-Alexandrium_andersonii.AAC.1
MSKSEFWRTPGPESEVLTAAHRLGVHPDMVVECSDLFPPAAVKLHESLQRQHFGNKKFESKLFWIENPGCDSMEPGEPELWALHI